MGQGVQIHPHALGLVSRSVTQFLISGKNDATLDGKEEIDMPRICVFDVNETLLDLRALDAQFARVFGDASLRQAWFSQMLQNAFVATITGPYRNFGTLGAAALNIVPSTPEGTSSARISAACALAHRIRSATVPCGAPFRR
jgi:2-haloacid dehalogenase